MIQETLRLRPVISLVNRTLKEPMEFGGYELPAGVKVAPCIYLVHRRPDIYPEPDRFLPERFLDQPPGTYTWIPFGGGVRRCLGGAFAQFEMQVVLRELVRRRTLSPARGGDERVYRRAITETPRHDAEVPGRMKPKTRREKQAETRSSLLRSAAKLFCRRGLEGASVEDVAQDAGYTKGAFYSNFKSKEELFLVMLDEKFGARARADRPPPGRHRRAARGGARTPRRTSSATWTATPSGRACTSSSSPTRRATRTSARSSRPATARCARG